MGKKILSHLKYILQSMHCTALITTVLTFVFPADSLVKHSMQLLQGTDFQCEVLHFNHGEARSRAAIHHPG